MRTEVSFNDLELICESARELVLRYGDNNDKSKLPQINHDSVRGIINLNVPQYQALPKDELQKVILKTIVESYDFSPSVRTGMRLLG
jgi:tRNA splicing ligase